MRMQAIRNKHIREQLTVAADENRRHGWRMFKLGILVGVSLTGAVIWLALAIAQHLYV